MSTSTNNNTSVQNLDELDRQIKQAEMIRQYLQVTNIDTNSLPITHSTLKSEPYQLSSTTTIVPLLSFNFNELRKDLKMAEERVERLRQELKEIQNKREDSFLKSPPPPYVPPSINNTNSEFLNHNILIYPNRGILDRSTSPIGQELLSSQRQMINHTSSPAIILPHYNSVNYVIPASGGLSAAFADLSKDHRQRQFLLTMRQHREQLVIYLDSLKQVLNSLEQLASLEPTRSEIHLANMKLDTIQQKSRQLRALKSNRSSQQSPFIECRIRQLEHDLVYMLSEHQNDVQSKLELNEQRSLMLLKIMHVTDELASVDQQIQQLLSYTDIHRITPSPLSNEITHQQPLRINYPTNNLDEQRVSFRDPTDNNPLTKLTNAYYHHHH